MNKPAVMLAVNPGLEEFFTQELDDLAEIYLLNPWLTLCDEFTRRKDEDLSFQDIKDMELDWRVAHTHIVFLLNKAHHIVFQGRFLANSGLYIQYTQRLESFTWLLCTDRTRPTPPWLLFPQRAPRTNIMTNLSAAIDLLKKGLT